MNEEISARLFGERKRLGLNQTQMAEAGGVVLSAYHNYEKGKRVPDAEFLARISLIGADALFIVTGRREGGEISSNEEELIRAYREATPERQAALVDMAKALAVVSRE